MPVSADTLTAILQGAYPDATHINALDISGGCGASYEITIVSPAFEGKTTLKRHREVNEKLKAEIAELHAFTQKTYTPAQWEKMNTPTA